MGKKRPRITEEVLRKVAPPTGVDIHTTSGSSEVVGEALKPVARRFRKYVGRKSPAKIGIKKHRY